MKAIFRPVALAALALASAAAPAAAWEVIGAGGEKIPRKGGPGVTRSDLLVINKTDLAPHVGASLEVMARDAKVQRRDRPFVMANMKSGQGAKEIEAFILEKGGLAR